MEIPNTDSAAAVWEECKANPQVKGEAPNRREDEVRPVGAAQPSPDNGGQEENPLEGQVILLAWLMSENIIQKQQDNKEPWDTFKRAKR